VTKLMSKPELIQKIAEQHPNKLTRDDIKGVLDALVDIGHAELRKTGAFLVHGFAKFVVVEKPATEAHQGVNPFTKEPMLFEAKPATKVVKARPVQAAKDAVSRNRTLPPRRRGASLSSHVIVHLRDFMYGRCSSSPRWNSGQP
jgi:DNA-binding protein HU-beta